MLGNPLPQILGTKPSTFPILILGIGQCGVTIAHEFFMQIQGHPELNPTFFFQKASKGQTEPVWIPRCVLLDTEPKVLQTILQEAKKKSWLYHPKCILWRKTGAANNWAYGYNRHGASMYAFIQKAIHYQLRECGEHFGGFVILHSLAGGTGSGLGSFVTEQLRKEYPQATLLNQVVWPFFNGEVIIQHYNIMLTLYHLIKHSSLILILFNDHLKLICEHRLGKLSTTFTDLNQFIALILYHLLSPCKNSRTHQLSPLSSLVQLIVVSQKMNLATVYLVPQVPTHAIPFSTFTWYMLLRSLYRMVASHSPTDETTSHSPKHQPLLYSLVLILKYEKKIHSSLDLREKEMLQKFSHPSFFVNKKVRVGLFNYTGTGISGISQLALALCNSTSIYHALEQSIEAAVQMYQVGAYLHPYLHFDMKKLDFEECFRFMYKVLQCYRHESQCISIP